MAKKDPKKNKIVKMSNEDAAMEIVNFARESRAPIVSERMQKSKPWVFWGSDNLYPNDLIGLADNSALHSAILDTKAKMIAGDGVVFDNEEARNFLESATEKWGGLSKVIERMATDTAYFSTHAVNVQFNKGGKIDEIKHSDISYLRSGKMDINTRSITSHYHSTRWDISTNKRSYAKDEEIYRPVEIISFNENRKQEGISRKNGQLIISKRYNPSVIYYAKPGYIGAYNYIDISAKIANFHRSQLDNGMAGNMHIHLMQDLSNATKRKKVTQELSNQYTGTNNAGRIVLTWGTNPQNIPIVTQIQSNDAHEQLALLNTKVSEAIVSGHSIPRILTQLDSKTGLGGVETAEALDMYQTLTINPDQKLIEDTLNKILKFNGIKSEVKIEKLKPSTLILSDTLMKLSTTVDEVRAIRSMEPLKDKDKGEMLLAEVEPKKNNKDGEGSDTTGKK